jgi:hypothetical protein
MLKFYLKKVHLNFIEGWKILETQMINENLDDIDTLTELLKENFQDKLDKMIKCINKEE